MGSSISSLPMHPPVINDPTITAELYTWSSAEFRDQYALIYTSRSNPSQKCISHYKVNRDKILFTFHDCLCEGNTVRVDMEIVGDKDHNGYFVVRSAQAHESMGSFMEKIDNPSMFHYLKYQDLTQRRIGVLELYMYCRPWRGDYNVRFTTGIVGNLYLTYFARVICNPLKGLDVDISGPYCEPGDYIWPRRPPLGLCYLNHVSGMPTHDVVKEKKQGNDVGGTLGSTQSITAIVNSGTSQGNFNGSNFKDCKIVNLTG